LFSLRRQKLPAEIALMRLANADNVAALDEAFAHVRVGTTDREILARSLMHQQLHNGEILTHSTCNLHAKAWRWFPERHRVRAGETFFVDQVYYGEGGYASDITRTVALNEPHPAAASAYMKLIEVARDLHEVARAGARVSVLDDHMNRALVKHGLQPSPYGLGHGIGLRVMEPPSLSPSDLLDSAATVLISGEVIAIEPETAIEINGEIVLLKVEDCFIVTADGLEPLGEIAPPELRILGDS
jgi:Xaa-Pro aminopeptidase